MTQRRAFRSKELGFTLVEMVVTLAVGLILVSMALPVMIGAIQGYRLNSVSQQTANLIELTRYAAIRRNTIVSLHKTVQNGNTIFFVDLDGDGALGAGEPMIMLPPLPSTTAAQSIFRSVAQRALISWRSDMRTNRNTGVARSPSFRWGKPRFGRRLPAARGQGCKGENALSKSEWLFCRRRVGAARLFRAGDDPGQCHSDGRHCFRGATGAGELEE